MKLWLLLPPAVLLAGCMSLSPVVAEVRSSNEPVVTVCSEVSTEEALRRLENAWKRCQERRGHDQPILSGTLVVGYAPGKQALAVNRETNPNGESVIVRDIGNKKFVWMIADVKQTSQCRSAIELRGANFAWQSVAKRSQKFVDEPDAVCPII